MDDRTSIREEIAQLKELLENGKLKKHKKFTIPIKARVGRAKLKKGFVTVCQIDANKNVDFKKVPIEDSTYKLDETYHAISEDDIFLYKNKPFVFQPKNKLNPWRLGQDNETYGQEYVMAKMMKDVIKPKRKIGGSFIIILLLVIGGIYWFASRGGAT